MKWAIDNKIAVGGMTTAILAINAAITYRNIQKAIADNYRVNHSNEVLAALEGTLSTLKDALNRTARLLDCCSRKLSGTL